MSGNNVRKFNPLEDKPIEIKGFVKKGITKELVFDQSKIIVPDENLQMSYTIFVLQKMSVEHDLSYENILMLVYLKELGLFRLQLTMLDRNPKVGHFENRGLIVQDYSRKDILIYKLTKEGIDLVQEFYTLLSRPDPFLSSNRITDIGLDKNMRSFLDDYFK